MYIVEERHRLEIRLLSPIHSSPKKASRQINLEVGLVAAWYVTIEDLVTSKNPLPCLTGYS